MKWKLLTDVRKIGKGTVIRYRYKGNSEVEEIGIVYDIRIKEQGGPQQIWARWAVVSDEDEKEVIKRAKYSNDTGFVFPMGEKDMNEEVINEYLDTRKAKIYRRKESKK